MSADLDREIDRAVREMLDVEPPAGFRVRVMARIDDPRRGRSWGWLAAPVAAAALIVLAVLAAWIGRPSVSTPAATIAGGRPAPLPNPVAPPTIGKQTPPSVRSMPSPEDGRPRGTVRAAVADETAGSVEPDVNITTVDALTVPSPIAVEQLVHPAPPPQRSIEPAPIQIAALAVDDLQDAPQNRREE